VFLNKNKLLLKNNKKIHTNYSTYEIMPLWNVYRQLNSILKSSMCNHIPKSLKLIFNESVIKYF